MPDDPFQSPLEFIKKVRQNPEITSEEALAQLPPELQEIIKSLGCLPGLGRVVVKGDGQTFEIPLGEKKSADKAETLATAAVDRLKKRMPKQRDAEFTQASEDLASYIAALEEFDKTPDEMLFGYLHQQGICGDLTETLQHAAAFMVKGHMEDVFNTESISRLLEETDLMEGFTLLAVGFFIVGMRTERLKADRVRTGEIRRSSERGDPAPPETPGGAQ